MAKFAPVKEGGDFEKLQPGTYQAVVSNFYDIGCHMKKDSKTGETIPKNQCIVLFEINKRMSIGKFSGERFVQSAFYNFTMSKKSSLRIMVESLFGSIDDSEAAMFDLDTLRNTNCILTIEKNGEYMNIKTIGPIVEGMQVVKPELPIDYLPEWINKKMAAQLPPEDAPTHSENTYHDENIPTEESNSLLEWEIIDLVSTGQITEGERKSQIYKTCGKPTEWDRMTEEQQIKVADTLKGLADFRKNEKASIRKPKTPTKTEGY